jgi:predicted NAD/FAD-binding protein
MEKSNLSRVAVIGSGISGLAVAWQFAEARARAQVTLFEAGDHFGGHANTVDVTLNGISCGVDTGFLVFNPHTYPNLVRLFAALDVEVAPAEMSFSVQSGDLEWAGTSLSAVFAQRGNLLRPGHWAMLADIVRFNRLARALAAQQLDAGLQQTIGEFLEQHRFGVPFRDGYLLPMIACIWSCPSEQMLRFPVGTLIRFCHNHGLIQLTNRPPWFTVRGGSARYVQKMVARLSDARLSTPVLAVRRSAAGVRLITPQGPESFDAVVFACHSDQALQLLGDGATAAERRLLGAIRYHPNTAVLHTDAALLPRRRRAWAAWNYERGRDTQQVCLHYLINRLQPLPWQQPVIVSMNPVREPDPAKVLRRLAYAHPVFDQSALRAQQRLASLQGQQRSWFCGAWCGYGFHEDGLKAGLAVAESLQAVLPQLVPEQRHAA